VTRHRWIRACKTALSHLKGENMGEVINFPEKEELKNFKLMQTITNSKETRNKRARRRFFSWFRKEWK